MAKPKKPVKTTEPADGSKYFHYQQYFIRTGSLRALDLMMRHYQAGDFAVPIELPRVRPLPWECRHPLAKALGTTDEFAEDHSKMSPIFEPCVSEGCIVYLCDICVSFFVRHSILNDCEIAHRRMGRSVDVPL
jgi:hypothetical protein